MGKQLIIFIHTFKYMRRFLHSSTNQSDPRKSSINLRRVSLQSQPAWIIQIRTITVGISKKDSAELIFVLVKKDILLNSAFDCCSDHDDAFPSLSSDNFLQLFFGWWFFGSRPKVLFGY